MLVNKGSLQCRHACTVSSVHMHASTREKWKTRNKNKEKNYRPLLNMTWARGADGSEGNTASRSKDTHAHTRDNLAKRVSRVPSSQPSLFIVPCGHRCLSALMGCLSISFRQALGFLVHRTTAATSKCVRNFKRCRETFRRQSARCLSPQPPISSCALPSPARRPRLFANT